MSFALINFAVLLALGLAGFHLTGGRWRRHLLLLLSWTFYLCYGTWHFALLLAITGAAYFVARGLRRGSNRSRFELLLLTVICLLAVLSFFKCAGTSALGFVAPLGLSYYLFKVIGYLLDVYWEKLPPERNFISFALYVSFFPQILVGPIQRAGHFFSQLDGLAEPVAGDVVAGLRRILLGLFKKVVIADSLTQSVSALHAAPGRYSPPELLLGAYLFAFQIYADFSGVTDIAIGVGRLFGILGPENFDRPFLARNIQEFWRRWHMSLTSWLTDYVFMPLSFSLRASGALGRSVAIFVTMLAVGVWHGPTGAYAAFGVLNGVYMIVSSLTLKQRNRFFGAHATLRRWRVFAGPVLTFQLVAAALVLFRANTLHSGVLYLAHLLPGLQSPGVPVCRLDCARLLLQPARLCLILACVGGMEWVHWAAQERIWVARAEALPRWVRWGAYYAMLLLIALSVEEDTKGFIYAQF